MRALPSARLVVKVIILALLPTVVWRVSHTNLFADSVVLFMMVFYLISLLIKRSEGYHDQIRRLNWVLGYVISINLGMNLFTAELSGSRFGRFLTPPPLPFENIHLYVIAPLLAFLVLVSILLISQRSHSYLKKKDESGFHAKSREDLLSLSYIFLIVLLILIIVFEIGQHAIFFGANWLTFDPISSIYFVETASLGFRLWLSIFALVFFMYPLAFLLDFLYLKLSTTSRKLKKIEKKELEEGGKYLVLIRKYYSSWIVALLSFFTIYAVLITLETFSIVGVTQLPLSRVGQISITTILLATVLTSSMLLFLYLSYSGYKFWIVEVGKPREFRSIYSRFQRLMRNRCLSFTVTSSLLMISVFAVRWLAEALFLTPIPLFDELFANSAAMLFIFILAVWIYGFTTFYVYAYGKKPIFAAIFAFASSWVISELTTLFVPYIVHSLEISFFQSFVVFVATYILSESLENYIKAKFRARKDER